jgi:predicted nucleic acid-binding protein
VIETYVMDASVVAKWHLRDEQGLDEADYVRALAFAGQAWLTAPALLRYELPNLLLKAVRNERLDPGALIPAIDDFATQLIDFYSYDERSSAAITAIATSYGLSFYDASYVALAQLTGATLVLADKKMLKAAQAMGLPRTSIGL